MSDLSITLNHIHRLTILPLLALLRCIRCHDHSLCKKYKYIICKFLYLLFYTIALDFLKIYIEIL